MVEDLEWIIWIITGRCNLRCTHCYASIYEREKELPLKTVVNLLREASELGVAHISFTGGEPLLRRDIFEILLHARDLGFSINIFTNSTLVTEKIASRFARLEVGVNTSIDGPNPKVHERLRGPGSWTHAIEGIKRLVDHGLHVHVNVTITRLNYLYVGETVRKAYELSASSVSVIPAMPAGRALENRVYAEMPHVEKALEQVDRVASEDRVPVGVWCVPFCHSLISSELVYCSSTCRRWRVVDLSPSGRLLLCDVLGIGGGNAATQGLREAYRTLAGYPMYKEVVQSPRPVGRCISCRLWNRCLGGCYARSLRLRGTPHGPDPLCLSPPGQHR